MKNCKETTVWHYNQHLNNRDALALAILIGNTFQVLRIGSSDIHRKDRQCFYQKLRKESNWDNCEKNYSIRHKITGKNVWRFYGEECQMSVG